jgi:glycosyltransferase involved in cell wall biosynthesis
MRNTQAPPVVSVVIATKNRGRKLVETVESILRNPADRWELIIVDQSPTSAAQDALEESQLLQEPRLTYERVSTSGVCRARNHGIAIALGDVVVFTDDDCIVPIDWVEATRRQFEADPDLDVFFGGVTTPPSADGWSYRFQPTQEGIVPPGYKNMNWKFGLASNMAIRRSAFAVIGPFDEMLGAGAIFAPSDDADYGYRAMRLGRRVRAASQPEVLHLGINRSGRESARHQIGSAAMSIKHVRCGDVGLLWILGGQMARMLSDGTIHLLRGRRPSGYRTAAYMALGVIRSLRHPVDVQARIYRTPSGASAVSHG